MSDESHLQVTRQDGSSSLSLSKVLSGLIARGRSDAAMLPARQEAKCEEQRLGLISLVEVEVWNGRPTEEVREAAEKGDVKQQEILAWRCWIESLKDKVRASSYAAEAIMWHRRAADQSYPPAQFNIAWWYDARFGDTQSGPDYVQAAHWYRKAADQGYAPAQYNLAVMYSSGEGVAQDHAEAVRWYRKAADQGLSQARFNLGLKYDKGEGVAQDYAEAAKWYRKAAEQGHMTAQKALAILYLGGKGAPQDLVLAHMWTDITASLSQGEQRKTYAQWRDHIAALMTPAQIAEAQRLARNWQPIKEDT